MKKYIVYLLLLLFCHACKSQTNIYLPSEHYPNLQYLIKDIQLWDYLIITEESITIYENLEAKMQSKPECRIYTEEVPDVKRLIEILPTDSLLFFYKEKKLNRIKDMPTYAKYLVKKQNEKAKIRVDSSAPLKGLKIALDPGHIESTMEMAKVEAKFIKMKPSDATGLVPISFNEANLTLATAYFLAEKLKSAGAEVMITRPKAGIGLLEMTFEEWYNTRKYNDLKAEMLAGRMDSSFRTQYFFQNDATKTDWYSRVYVPIDLRLRAEKINAFKPDLTVMIHYNVHGPNWEKRDEADNTSPTDKNYNMSFVAGSFKAYELQKMEDRVAFLRLLLTDDIQKSIAFSEKITHSFTTVLGISAVNTAEDLIYLKNSSIYTEKTGVYARNLGLTRNVKGVLCYGETLCQDNISESAWLNQRLVEINGMKTSSRVRMVADAYYQGILNYVKTRQ